MGCAAQESAVLNSGMLLMAVMALLLPALLHFTRTEAHRGESGLALSRFSSCVMLVAYAGYLIFQLKTQKNQSDKENEVRKYACIPNEPCIESTLRSSVPDKVGYRHLSFRIME